MTEVKHLGDVEVAGYRIPVVLTDIEDDGEFDPKLMRIAISKDLPDHLRVSVICHEIFEAAAEFSGHKNIEEVILAFEWLAVPALRRLFEDVGDWV